MYDSRTIANRFLDLAKQRGETITPMQVLKLVYIAHGWMLALYHRSLIRDEVQAWQYGPVIPKLYNAVRKYKGREVTERLSAPAETIDYSAESIIAQVSEKYGRLTGPALSRLTHAPNTPWALTFEPGSFGVVIPNDLIEDHYVRLATL